MNIVVLLSAPQRIVRQSRQHSIYVLVRGELNMYTSGRNAEERASILRTTQMDLYELLARKLTEEFRRRRLHTNPNFNSIGLTYDFREEPPGFIDFANV
ncbi:hypothetical protein DdX_02655 [Ditylenchus destructor]|uniref:Uncharacterized protein n=1 Tax=Ditylenchus destructor TaxID=166010 RepID=A0AAD4ND00_9BILA|nr:hypothetical protein DdX_02655 [Ditylenchus destructor]